MYQYRVPLFHCSHMATFDLSNVQKILCCSFRGLGWDPYSADRAIELYRGWLWLLIIYPNATLPPLEVIRQVWHAHTQDIPLYQVDCFMLFERRTVPVDHGYLDGIHDPQLRLSHDRETLRLLQHHFPHLTESFA